jgi:hypothetical protein
LTENSSSSAPTPSGRLRLGALLVSGALSLLGSLATLLALPGQVSDARLAATWSLVQFISGVWAGVLGANNPFLHGLVAGIPALIAGLLIPSPLPRQFVLMAWFLAPCAALVAGLLMRARSRRAP